MNQPWQEMTDGVDYMPTTDPPGSVAIVRSKSGKTYQVLLPDEGAASCTCADFLFRRKPRGDLCKHISLVLQMRKEGHLG